MRELPVCGIVMPISAIDGCSEAHWAEVRAILEDAIVDAGFRPQLVSDSEEIGVIQKSIIQNLYDSDIVVCDVSGKNLNVMFELGMRLTFDKATVIVKDESTGYSFDTSPIRHIGYPRDLRFSSIMKFKKELTERLNATFDASKSDGYSTFLKHFGTYKIPRIETQEVGPQEYILQEIRSLRNLIVHRSAPIRPPRVTDDAHISSDAAIAFNITGLSAAGVKEFMQKVRELELKMRIIGGDTNKRLEIIDHPEPGITSKLNEYLKFIRNKG